MSVQRFNWVDYMWLLTVCTYGLMGACSQVIYAEYPTEDSCYRAVEQLVDVKGEESFHYLYCKPVKEG